MYTYIVCKRTTVNQQVLGFVKFRPTTTKARLATINFWRAAVQVNLLILYTMTTKFQPQ